MYRVTILKEIHREELEDHSVKATYESVFDQTVDFDPTAQVIKAINGRKRKPRKAKEEK